MGYQGLISGFTFIYIGWFFVKTKVFNKRDYFAFDIVNFPFCMVIFLARHPMVFIFLNLFNLLECPVMSMTLILGIKF